MTAKELVHAFAGNPLNRGTSIRHSGDKIDAMKELPSARYLVFQDLKVLTSDGAIDYVAYSSLPELTGDQIFLGTLNNTPYFAVQTDDGDFGEFTDCRQVVRQKDLSQSGIVAQARSMLAWHRKNPFCSRCGSETALERGGQLKRCLTCNATKYPRIDPVVIMLIEHPDDQNLCLLGKSQGRMASSNFYSALAGFVDQGESLEEAVRREVLEESGVFVGDLKYHSSQPWPFPSSLMIGFHGRARSTEISIDESEMADVRWFSKDKVSSAINRQDPSMMLPGPGAIAHHLIKSWTENSASLEF